MPRFVILEHHHQGVHWDFMLESGEVLRSWRLAARPDTDLSIEATALPDHRRIYLDYEGEISGGRGIVTRWDGGEFEWISEEPNSLVLAIRGQRLVGNVYLLRDDSGCWTFKPNPREFDSPELDAR